jgi:CRP/FNR family transcriptional regulator
MRSITQNMTKCKGCVIRSSSFFSHFEQNQLDKAHALRSSQEILTEGEHLYYEGDIAEHAYTIFKGWVILYKSLENGNRQILSFALPGDLLSYKIGKNRSLDHSAVAVSDVTLCTFPIDRFKSVISELPDLAIALGSMACLISERSNSTLTTIASHPAETKVAFLLLSLFIKERATSNSHKGDYCAYFPITQEDIGDALGLTSIHVNRVLQELRKKELIQCKNKCLRIPNQKALAKVAKIKMTELEALMLGP